MREFDFKPAEWLPSKNVANARERMEFHAITFLGGDAWQRIISRIELYEPIFMECPASIMRLFPGSCYVSEEIARPFESWKNGYGVENWNS